MVLVSKVLAYLWCYIVSKVLVGAVAVVQPFSSPHPHMSALTR